MMASKPPIPGVLRIHGERIPITSDTTPLAILYWVWRQVEPADRLAFLTEMLTPNERRALFFDEDLDRPFLYAQGQHVLLPNHGGIGVIGRQYLTRGSALSDVIEYDITCPDGETIRCYEADLIPVEDAPWGR